MIITISGYPGSGKSSAGSAIAEQLKYKFISVGDIRGEIALKHQMTINALNTLGETEDWTDKEVDEKQKALGKKDKIVFDSRLGFFFIPKSVKIFLSVSLEEGAKRMIASHRDSNEEEIGKTIPEQIKLIKERINSDNKRYMQYYNVTFDKKENFDLWLDTTHLSKEKVVEEIMKFMKSKGRLS
jgi:predicted cytidylate kinase